MSVDTIGQRVRFQHMQQKADEEIGGTLLVPALAWNSIPPSRVTSTKWFLTLKSAIQCAVDAGVFGKASTEQILSETFKDAKRGWCAGFSLCISADRSPRIPIAETIKTIFTSPQRPWLIQMCGLLRSNLKFALSANQRAPHHFEKARRKGEPRIKKFPPHQQKILRETVAFCERQGILNYDDPRLAEKKWELTSNFAGRPALVKKMALDSACKEQSAQELKRKISDLMKEILGGSRPQASAKVMTEDPDYQEKMVKLSTSGRRCREMMILYPGHVRSVIVQGGKRYAFDSNIGLVQMEGQKSVNRLFKYKFDGLEVFYR